MVEIVWNVQDVYPIIDLVRFVFYNRYTEFIVFIRFKSTGKTQKFARFLIVIDRVLLYVLQHKTLRISARVIMLS